MKTTLRYHQTWYDVEGQVTLLFAFWDRGAPKLDSVDLFCTKLQGQKDSWLRTGQADSIWFWGYQSQVALDAGMYQTAFRSASKAIDILNDYTKV